MSLPYQPLDRRSRVATAVVASLAIHAAVLPWVARDWVFKLPVQVKRTAVSLIGARSGASAPGARPSPGSLPSTGLSQARPRPADPAREKERTEEEKEQERLRLNGQIVSLGPPQDERPPTEPTRYLSERDSRVLKETRARETSAFFKNALGKVQKEGKQERVENPQRAGEKAVAELPQGITQAPGKAGGGQIARAAAPQIPSRAQQDRVQIPTAPDGTVRNRSASDALQGSGRKLALAQPQLQLGPAHAEGAGAGAPGNLPGLPGGKFPNLKLTLDNPLESLGPIAGGPMPDHLQGVEEGEETLLNSRSFRYAGYLNRVKETVGRIWVSDVQDVAQRRDPTGQTYSFKDRRTVVEFTLDKAGEIRDVKVSASSGVDYLDRVAVEAFKKAERFPNPPPGLLGDQGVVTLPFAFTLLASTGSARISIGPAYLPGSPAQRGF